MTLISRPQPPLAPHADHLTGHKQRGSSSRTRSCFANCASSAPTPARPTLACLPSNPASAPKPPCAPAVLLCEARLLLQQRLQLPPHRLVQELVLLAAGRAATFLQPAGRHRQRHTATMSGACREGEAGSGGAEPGNRRPPRPQAESTPQQASTASSRLLRQAARPSRAPARPTRPVAEQNSVTPSTPRLAPNTSLHPDPLSWHTPLRP